MRSTSILAALVVLSIVGALAFFWSKFESLPELKEPAAMDVAENAAPLKTERVVSVYVTIPAKGTVTIPLEKRCYADSFTDDAGRKVTRTETAAGLVYHSTNLSDITRKVWFFDEGGDCAKDFATLAPTQVFK